MVLQSSDAGSQEKVQSLEASNHSLLISQEQMNSEIADLNTRNKKLAKELRESTQQCKQTLSEFTDLHERLLYILVK